VTLLLMGFPNINLYRAKAVDLGVADRVIFTGRVPYAEAPLHLALGDVAVAPKLSLTEGAGKLLNYMAVGLPIVAFDTPVAREYLGDDGLLAERGNSRALADSIDALLANPERAAAQGAQLRRRAVQHFDWWQAGVRIVETYRKLLPPAPVKPATAATSAHTHPGSSRT
jgi:glycosyltransferase involved in cell wall biosynthesis